MTKDETQDERRKPTSPLRRRGLKPKTATPDADRKPGDFESWGNLKQENKRKIKK